jgi:endo-1,4-beta-xylanase
MKESELIRSAEERIARHRAADADLSFVTPDGAAIPGFKGRVKLVRHEFKLGANAFRVGNIADGGLQRDYNDRFAALMNYATLPFYWGSYEREKDKPEAERLRAMAEWCAANGIIAKGHPLAWHEAYPSWAASLPDAEVLERLEERIRRIVAEFRGLVDIWDIFNEATVSERFDNAVGRWVKSRGAAECVGRALGWAHAAAPNATLLYNDFNVSPEFEALVAALISSNAPVHTIGIQSHMHKRVRPLQWVWDTCEKYARFGLPLHFTEATILSGRPKAEDDNDWQRVHSDWGTTKKGEAAQLSYGKRFYTLLFSHPAVEAITWWDFSDDGAWQGAPAGLVRKDMSPKPLYDWLVKSFCPGGQWSTDAAVAADADGRATARCFFGDYEVTGKAGSGGSLRGQFTLSRKGAKDAEVVLT